MKPGLAMRADAGDYEEYAAQYEETKNGFGEEVDWDAFNELWEERLESDEDMAALLAEVMGVDYETALAWVEDRDTG
jgi:hypothetical protein